MRIVNHSCPHGLVPGPYHEAGEYTWEDHQQEHRWLLDVETTALRADHVVLPTEAITYPRNGFTFDKLRWLASEVRARGARPAVWIDKWLYSRTLMDVLAWVRKAVKATQDLEPVLNLGQELDLLWLLHPGVERRHVLQNLVLAREEALALGMPLRDVWAGGATVEGTVEIDEVVAPGVLTWTGYRATERGIPSGRHGVTTAVIHDLAQIQAGRTRPGPLAAVEIGWSSQNVSQGHEALFLSEEERRDLSPEGRRQMVQARILREQLIGVREAGAAPGLWTGASWTHDTRNLAESGYGVLDPEGAPKLALETWAKLV
ncbi:MAG: hypothetical protein HY689_00245 [Chloroflexi bacterium]|nr:hypothetical protein [Chloroflexota bacterium]